MPFYHATETPKHLQASIDAVALAFMAHQTAAERPFALAREKYAVALRVTSQALRSDMATLDSTLLSAMILDLFEKFMHSEPSSIEAYTGHITGALALVQMRGLEKFSGKFSAFMLNRLSMNLLISCVASGTRVPDGLVLLKEYAWARLNVEPDPKTELSDLMVNYANLRGDVVTGHIKGREQVNQSIDLDAKLQAIALNMPPLWQCKTTLLDRDSKHVFRRRVDSYLNRHVTQTWNVIGLVRIILNEFLIEYYTSTNEALYSSLVTVAKNNIEMLARQICFSVPQFVDCPGICDGQHSSPLKVYPRLTGTNDTTSEHDHDPDWNINCYTLIYPMYVAGRSEFASADIRDWITQQLFFMGSHFHIPNATTVASILKSEKNIAPWDIYGLLGSYAFAA